MSERSLRLLEDNPLPKRPGAMRDQVHLYPIDTPLARYIVHDTLPDAAQAQQEARQRHADAVHMEVAKAIFPIHDALPDDTE